MIDSDLEKQEWPSALPNKWQETIVMSCIVFKHSARVSFYRWTDLDFYYVLNYFKRWYNYQQMVETLTDFNSARRVSHGMG